MSRKYRSFNIRYKLTVCFVFWGSRSDGHVIFICKVLKDMSQERGPHVRCYAESQKE